ncbi:MAG: PD40 domain-containing protein [Planctomycetes bacterium]|nr:PD40 domain-containing protein [Planctomycetota bacterium]
MSETLGPYELLGLIGRGGMGEVHLARDPKLDRKVALKLLPPELAEDPDRRSRFLREARAAATLNHPNITTVYDVGEAAGRDYIAQEYLEGRPLNELLAERRLPLAELADIAVPLADALEYAHERGVIHRDLKPGNVIVTTRGHAKLLDFGLAKVLRGEDDPRPHDDQSTTLTLSGAVMGTPSAMSPEQALGKPVDARADVFAFGALLYEMAAGKPAFLGTTVQETLDKVLRGEPEPLGRVRRDLPSDFVRIVDKALRKDPAERYQGMAELAADLRHFKRTTDSGMVPPATAGGRRAGGTRALRRLGIVLLVATAAWLARDAFGPAGGGGGPSAIPRLTNPRQITSAVGAETAPSWSGQGGLIAFQASSDADGSGEQDIWVTQIGAGSPVNRTADVPGICFQPSLSPDGTTIVFSIIDVERPARTGLYATPALSGPARLLIPGETSQGPVQWSSDGRRMARLHRVDGSDWSIRVSALSGETLREIPLQADPQRDRSGLAWSRDERLFAFVAVDDPINSDTSRLWLLREADRTYVPLTDGRTLARCPGFTADGRALHYVSNQGGTMDLWRQRLDEDGSPVGEPVTLTAGLGMWDAAFSPDGSQLAYCRGRVVSNVWRIPFGGERPATWTDARQVTYDEAVVEFADLSPDGQSLALTTDRGGNDDLWIMPAAGGAMRQFTTDPSPDWYAQWSPDGEQILFYSYRTGNRDLWIMPGAGGPARQLTDAPGSDWFGKWSPDGSRIAYVRWGDAQPQLMLTAVEPWDPRPILTTTDVIGVPTQSSVWVDDHTLVAMVDGDFALVSDTGEIQRVYAGSGPEQACTMVPGTRTILFHRGGQVAGLDLDSGELRVLTDLTGRPGDMGAVLTADAEQVWFTWFEARGDLWVMDVEGVE